jgi:hypothetical protein
MTWLRANVLAAHDEQVVSGEAGNSLDFRASGRVPILAAVADPT